MPSVEEDVVKLSIDKTGLEKGTAESISLIDKLKNALNFDSSVRSLKSLQNSTNSIDLSGIENAVEQVTSKFSIMEVAARRAVERTVDRLENFTVKELKSLTVDNVAAGWTKYADKTTAVQTIMAATANQFSDTGKQMEYVEEQLERLSWFTDETSYKFVDMVQNIGKFTSNGIKLESAVTAMQGISTWAALSGAGTEQAGRAMYNLSQAIGAGKVMAIDWKSIENANMSTEQFKQIVLETAAARKVLTKTTEGYVTADKKATVTTKNFTGTLQKGWFTSEILVESLNKFGKAAGLLKDFTDMTDLSAASALKVVDQYKSGVLDINQLSRDTGASAKDLQNILRQLGSAENELGLRAFRAAQETKTLKEATDYVKEAVSSGWMVSFEQIFGNYEESKKLWSSLSDELYEIFVVGGEHRNALLKAWHAAGGYEMLWEGVGNLWQALKNVTAPIHQAWEMIFPPLTSNRLLEWTKAFRDWSEGFKHAFDWAGNLRDIIPKPLADLFETLFPELKEKVTTPAEEVKTEMTQIADANEDMVQRILKTQPKLDEYARQAWRGDWSVNPKRFQMMREAGLYPEMIQNRVNELMGNGYRYKLDEAAIAEANRRLSGDYKKTSEDVKKTAEQAAKAEQDAKKAAEDAVDTSAIKTRVDKLGEIFLGLFELLRDITDLIEQINKFGWEVVKHVVEKVEPIADTALDITAGLSTDFTQKSLEFRQSGQLEKFFSELTETVNHSTDVISESIGNIWTNVSNSEGFADFKLSIDTLSTNFSNFIETLSGSIGDLLKNVDLESVGEGLTVVFSAIGDFSFEAASKVVEFFNSLASALGETWNLLSSSEDLDRFSKLLDTIWQKISEFASTKFSELTGSLSGIDFTAVTEGLTGLFTAIGKFSFDKTSDLIEFFGTLGTSIGEFWDKLTSGPGFEHLKKSFGEFSKVISESVLSGLASAGEIIEGIDFSKAGNDISTVFAGLADIAFDKIASGLDWIVSRKDQIKEFFALFSTKLAGAIESVASAFDHFANSTVNMSESGLGKLNKFFGGFVNDLWSAFYDSKYILANFRTGMNDAWKKVSDKIAEIDINGLLEKFNLGAAGAALASLAGLLASASSAIVSFSKVPHNFAKVLGKLADCLSEYTYLIRAEALLKISKAIAIFAVSLIGLTYVDGDRLDHAAAAMVAVLFAVALIIRALGKAFSLDPKKIFSKAEDVALELKEFAQGMLEAIKKVLTMGVFLIGFAAILFAVASIFKMFIDIDWHKLTTGFIVLGTAVVALVVVVAALSAIQKYIGDASSLGTTLFGLAAAFIALAFAIKIVAGIQFEKAWPAAVMLTAIIGVLILSIAQLDKDLKARTVLSISVALIALAAAVAIMAGPLALLSVIDWKKLLAASTAIGIIVVAFGAAVKLGSSGKSGAGAMLALAAAMLALSYAMVELGKNWGSALVGAVMFVVLGAAVLGCAKLLEFANSALEKIAPNLFIFGLGALACSAAVYVLAAAMPLIVDGLIALGKGIEEHGDEMLKALIAVILVAIAAFSAKIVLSKLSQGVTVIRNFIFSRLAEGVDAHNKRLAIAALIGVIAFVFGVLRALMPDIIDGLLGLLEATIDALAEGIIKHSGPILDAVGKLLAAVGILILDAIHHVLGWIPIIGDKVGGLIEDMKRSIVGVTIIDGGEMAGKMANSAITATKSAFEKQGINFDELMAQYIKKDANIATEAAAEVGESTVDSAAEARDERYDEVMANGFNAKDMFGNMLSDMPEAQELLNGKFSELANGNIESYTGAQIDALGASEDELSSSASALATVTGSNAKDNYDSAGNKNGKEYALGVKSGIEENAHFAIDAAQTLANSINNTLTGPKGFDEASPSKISEGIGMFYDKGLANGIEKNAGVATNATETMAGKVVASLRSTSSEINSFFDSGINLNPTISPVLDLSNLQNGMNNVNGLFSSTSYALSGSVNNIRSSQDLMSMRMEHMFQAKLDDVAAKLTEANENKMYEFNAPLYIDGRQVARATARYTNDELNRIARQDNRKVGIV